MRHLIVCCDGTWNSQDQDNVTNVRRLFDVLDKTDESYKNGQISHYVPGIGTEGNIVSRLVGGGLGLSVGFGPGRGLDSNVQEGYHWLITHYREGDLISLFGFSRGAYTARSLAGLIAMCGLINVSDVNEQETWRRIRKVHRWYQSGYQRQRYGKDQDGDARWRDGLTFRFDPIDAKNIPVHFIGVWDTVGSLGIPDPQRWLAPIFSSRHYEFNDVRLNPYVRHARHAVAMDERRGPFTPTLWEDVEPRPPDAPKRDVKEVWFPGSHMDVGGGHRETGLSDGALQWMINEARQTIHFGFHETTVKQQVRPDFLDLLHDDDRSALGWLNPVLEPLIEPFLSLRPRAVPLIDPKIDLSGRSKNVDDSVYQRQREDTPPIASGPYRPTRKLAGGEAQTVEVHARQPWNETGLYLEAGDYTFSAEGQWLDKDIPADPDGNTGLPNWRQPAVAAERLFRDVGTLIGESEKLYRRLSKNKQASFPFARREPDLPWMALVCYVANNAVSINGKRKADHQRIDICSNENKKTYHVSTPGYLYAFANDTWGFYGNNIGSIRLTVTRNSDTQNIQNTAPVPTPMSKPFGWGNPY
ncbi:hypothetical protein FDG2_3323 [Candidatus Protofrankia californiensis]|uniref:T6SS Phospholipase effector Tle1-like catalytic domain-containing protein n=1 Tax=Candidatus Protofrankia californiensis TaxID=1839754 RepID=A0A1C3NZG0_9ACTN|nr:hypothetical protein FDG2_3323 [Candidatus Protofrankia californiensis]